MVVSARANCSPIGQVFISYAHEDLAWARRCSALLRMVGVRTFLDETSLRAGQRWPEVLEANIRQADRVLLGWSEYARHSEWVQREWRTAQAIHGEDLERVLVIDKLDATSLPIELQSMWASQGVDSARSVDVEITVRKDYERFHASGEELLKYVLATFLGTSPNGVMVVHGRDPMLVTLRLEAGAAHRLDSAYAKRTPAALDILDALRIQSINVCWNDAGRRAALVSMVAPARASTAGVNAVETPDALRSAAPRSLARSTEWEFFVAHSHEDRPEYVQQLADALRGSGYRVFFDANLSKRADAQQEVESVLQSARVIVVVVPLDESHMNSYWRAIIGRATTMHMLDARERLIVPLLPQPASRFRQGALPSGLLNIHAIDTSQKDLPAVVRELTEQFSQQQSSTCEHTPFESVSGDGDDVSPIPSCAMIELTLGRSHAQVLHQELAALALLLGVEPTRLHFEEVGQNTTVASVELGPAELQDLERLLAVSRHGLQEQAICHIRRGGVGEPWRVIYDASERTRGELPPIGNLPTEPRAQHANLPNVLDVANPWSVIALRNKLDGCLDEREVILALLPELRSLPEVERTALHIVRGNDGSLVRYPQKQEDSELATDSLASELRECLKTLRPRSCGIDGQLHHFVPLVDLHVAVGVMDITLRRPDQQTINFCNRLAGEIGSSIHRIRRQEAYHDIARSTADALVVQQQLDGMLDEIIALGFSYAAVSVADRFAGDIEMVQAKNVPTAWMIRAKHKLDDADIIPDVYRSQKATGVMTGWDKRLDVEIYERFEHKNLARIFAPLLVDGFCVGVIEYGCPVSTQDRVFTEENVQRVTQVLSSHVRREFVLTRPGVLLARVARYAKDALHADASTIYIFEQLQDLSVSLNAPILMAGAGVDPKFLRDVVPRPDGLGHRAMRAREILAWQENNLRAQHRKLWERGVKTLVAVPLLRGYQPAELRARCGVLYLEYRAAPRQLTAAERGAAAVFARHAEIMIGNMLLAEHARIRNEEQLRNARLLDIVRALPGSRLSHVLSEVARNVLQLLDADNVVLYEYLQKEDKFLPPTLNGYFLERDAMDQQPSDEVARFVLEHGHQFYPTADSESFLVGVREKQTRFVVRENIRSCAMLALQDGGETVGVMFVNYRHAGGFSKAKKRELKTLADSVGMSIRRSRELKKSEERRQLELEALQEVEVSLTNVDLDTMSSVLQLILTRGTKVVGASAGIIMLLDSEGQCLRSAATHGFPPLALPVTQSTGKGIVGKAFVDRQPQLVRNVREGEWPKVYVPTIPNTVSELAVPILRQGTARGVINFEAPRAGAFDELDCAFVDSLCRQVALVMACLERFREPIAQEQLIKLVHDRVAKETDSRVAAAIVLTSVTAGQGLGFSRAMLFARRSREMLVRLTVGPLRREEAEEAWAKARAAASRVPQATKEPTSVHAERVLHMFINRAYESAMDTTQPPAPLEQYLKGYGPIGIHESRNLLSRCVRENKPLVASSNDEDDIRELLRSAADDPVDSQLIAIPICVETSVEGVLLVDSEYLPATQQPLWKAIQRTGSCDILLSTLQSLARLIKL